MLNLRTVIDFIHEIFGDWLWDFDPRGTAGRNKPSWPRTILGLAGTIIFLLGALFVLVGEVAGGVHHRLSLGFFLATLAASAFVNGMMAKPAWWPWQLIFLAFWVMVVSWFVP